MSSNEKEEVVQKVETHLKGLTPRVDEVVAKSESVGTEIEACEEAIKESGQTISKRLGEIEELQDKLGKLEQRVQKSEIKISKLEAANNEQSQALGSQE
mmetsp:Transcript_28695/g.44090  ORF Transcript_28695/g.44090 Transcript_28695/m.44090 type:complete len:99 (-) Transcript_28695:62-358(-)